MEIKKNLEYEVEITDVTSEGNGVAKIDGFTVFIPNTAVGDKAIIKVVKVLKNYGYGIVTELITPSEDRVISDCSVYKKCGGCTFKHISYEAELKLKQKTVYDCFKRIGGFDILPKEIIGSNKSSHYRNKAQYPVGKDDNGNIVAGFFAKRSHRIIPSESCSLQPEIFSDIVTDTLTLIKDNDISVYDETAHKGAIRHIYLRYAESTGEIMLCLVSAVKKLSGIENLASQIVKKYPQIKSVMLNYNPEKTNVILGKESYLVYGKEYITDIMCGIRVNISAQAFYQVNKCQAEILYNKAIEYASLKKGDILLDLYCGIGTIGLSAADKVKKLIGVEIIPQAIKDAKINAKQNDIQNAEFLCDDCKGAVKTLLSKNIKPDVIIIDPPRKGCDIEVIEALCDFAPKRIVMVSCNPATAARDCKLLSERGYKVVEYTPVDMFPRTGHVETVVQLVRKKPDTYIDITVDMDELDLTSSEAKATYDEIKDYIFDKHRVKVSSLYVAQVKQKHGIIERDCYNNSKKDNPKQPQCPPEKVTLIEEALRHFKMIP